MILPVTFPSPSDSDSDPDVDADPAVEVVETLSRRRRILAALEDRPRRKRDLVDALDRSRSTIDRAIRELETLGFVERGGGTCRLTAAGRLALAEHRRSVDVFAAITDACDLLADVPPDAPMSPAMLEGATIHEPAPYAPNEAVKAIMDRLDDAERFRAAIVADRIPRFRQRLAELSVDGSLDHEAVLTADLAAHLFATHTEQMRTAMIDGDVDLYRTPSLPYDLGVLETDSRSVAIVIVSDPDESITGVITNDSPAAVEWAETTYRRFRATAERLDPPGPDPDSGDE